MTLKIILNTIEYNKCDGCSSNENAKMDVWLD